MINDIEKRLFGYIKKQKVSLIGGMICSAIVTLITLGTAFVIKETINAFQVTNGDLRQCIRKLDIIAVAVLGIYVFKYIFTFGQSYLLGLTANRIAKDLRDNIFSHIQKLPIGFFHEKRSGWFQSLMSNDVNVVQNGMTSIKELIDSPLKFFGGIGTLFYFNWKLAIVVLVCLPFAGIAIQRIGRKVKTITGRVQGMLADISSSVDETVSGARVIRAFTKEDYETGRFQTQNNNTLKEMMRSVKRIAQLKPTTELIGALAIMFVLWYGGRLVLHGELTAGDLMAFLYVIDQVANSLIHIGSVNNTRQQVLAASTRIFSDLLDVQPEIADKPGAYDLKQANGEIVFDNVNFQYPEQTAGVNNINLTIKPGSFVALVGHSGAGKSTLMDLLLRFYDVTSGKITLDGHDIRELTMNSLRSHIAVVPQQVLLFARTIKDNIRYGNLNASDDEVFSAAKAARAHDFIIEKEEGYDTLLGERGARLSGGEAQRLAIARAFLKDPAILVLDEATSALDAVSERAVQQALEETRSKRTLIMIAHRLSTARRADTILVMSDGRLVESGSHDDLMAIGGHYAAMYRAFESGVVNDPVEPVI